MIEYIKGKISVLTPAYAVIESAGGIGWRVNISLLTYSRLEGRAECLLYVHENIREDAWTLYGFSGESEREHFRLLTGVSGVGAATAMLILSALQGDELAAAIAGGDVRRLKAIKGIGAKTAERIIVDLRDKIEAAVLPATALAGGGAANAAFDEALAALIMLGFDKKLSHKTLTALFADDPALKVEAAIKKALSMM
ncbi:MAG: Holliday junction branch migration protein RuvA [Muribaculaceae bacterium]|nr:Holliday junction branch migration protein RuvA [Muribaculaceae bacterium]